jgi:hypothetical protein
LLSSIGVGAATVDTRLERDELVPGEEVRGVVVEVKGWRLRAGGERYPPRAQDLLQALGNRSVNY